MKGDRTTNYIKQLNIPDVLDSLNRDYGSKWRQGNITDVLKGDPRLDTILKLRKLTAGSSYETKTNHRGNPGVRRKKSKTKLIGLKKLRVDKNLTQREFAEQVSDKYGINFSEYMVSLYERGVNRPSAEIVKVLADFFGLTENEMQVEIDKMR